MNESPFKAFIELISFDRSLNALEHELLRLDKEILIIKDQQDSLNAEYDALKKTVHEAQKKVDALELDSKALDQKEITAKERLENVTNHKEYQSGKAELEKIKSKQHELEKEIIEAWATLENRQKLFERSKKETEHKLAERQETLQQIEQKKAALITQHQELMAQRPQKEQGVPAEWLEKYASMRSRVDNPVVPVDRGSCSACFYRVSDQDMILLGRHKLLQCKDCYRFLYTESPKNG